MAYSTLILGAVYTMPSLLSHFYFFEALFYYGIEEALPDKLRDPNTSIWELIRVTIGNHAPFNNFLIQV